MRRVAFRVVLRGYRRQYARHLNDVVVHLKDLDRVIVNHKAGAGLRDVFQVLDDQAVERLGAIGRDGPVQVAVQVPHQRAAVGPLEMPNVLTGGTGVCVNSSTSVNDNITTAAHAAGRVHVLNSEYFGRAALEAVRSTALLRCSGAVSCAVSR